MTAAILLAPLTTSWTITTALPRLYPSDAPIAVGAILWAVGHWRAPHVALHLPSRLVIAGLLGLVVTGVTSALQAPDPGLALDLSLRSLVAFGVSCWVSDLGLKPACAARALVLSAASEGLIAVIQFILGRSLGLGIVGEVAFGQNGSDEMVRSFGLTPHPNILGGVAGIGVIAATGLILVQRRPRWLGEVPALVAASAAVAASLSRSAFLGLLVALLILCGSGDWGIERSPRLRAAVSAIVITALAFILTHPDQYGTRIIAPLAAPSAASAVELRERSDVAQRIIQYSIALRLITSHPLLGVGAGNFMEAWRRLPDRAAVPILPVHNVPLLVLAEQGIVGFLAWAMVHLGIVREVMRQWNHIKSSWSLVWLSALSLIVTTSFFDFYFWQWEQGRLLWAVVLGLWESSLASEDAGEGARS